MKKQPSIQVQKDITITFFEEEKSGYYRPVNRVRCSKGVVKEFLADVINGAKKNNAILIEV